MRINEASGLFRKLKSETDRKSVLQIYESYVGILADLENRDLEAKQLQLIEAKLDELNLQATPANKAKYLKQRLKEFKSFLKTKFSLTPEGYYTGMGIIFGIIFGSAMGMSIGTSIGSGTGTAIGLSMGTGIGLALGIAYGAAKDAEAKKKGRVFKTKTT